MEPSFVIWPGVGQFYLVLSIGLSWHYFALDRSQSMATLVDLSVVFALHAFGILPISMVLVLNLLLVTWSTFKDGSEWGVVFAFLGLFYLTLGLRLGWDVTQKEFLSVVLIHGGAYMLSVLLANQFAVVLKDTELELSKAKISVANLRKIQSAIVETMPIGEASFRADGDFIQKNEVYEAIFQKYKIPLYANFWQQFPELEESLKSLSTDAEMFKKDLRFLNATKRLVSFAVACRRLYSAELNGPIWVFILQDQTESRELEAQLQQKEKLAAVGALAAGIAHEIRNPLTGMSGSIEMLQQSARDESEAKLMKIVLREIDRLNHLVTEFLDFAKPMQANLSQINLCQILIETLNQVRMRKDNPADLEIKMDLPERLMIFGDPDKLKQAFLNIFVNAIQAMEGRSEKLLKVAVKEQKIVISDTGSGMDEETLKRIFEPFYTKKPKGTGLGMAITYRIFESHEALVEVHSTLGEGTRFQIGFREGNS